MHNNSGSLSSEKCPLRKSAIEDLLGLRFSEDNKVQLLESGQETLQVIIDALSDARELICIEFYIFKDDHTGKRIAQLLKEKVKHGVKVYLLYDHFGSFLTSRAFWSDLKKVGIHISVSNPFKWSRRRGYMYRNHKKLLIIDGKKALVGGFNIADEYHVYLKKTKNSWRDTGIYLEGSIAFSLLGIFKKSWKTWKGGSIQFTTEAGPSIPGIPVIPIFANSGRARRKMRRLLIYSIKNAQKSILITTAYFSPGRRVVKALESAARRGVHLKLLLPGKTDVKSVFYAGRAYYSRLLKSGIELYNYEDAVLHSKTAVFDGCWSIIGSTNLDTQSLRRNEESNVGIFSTDFGRQMTEMFQKDLNKSVRIDLHAWGKRHFYQKILERIFYVIMRKL